MNLRTLLLPVCLLTLLPGCAGGGDNPEPPAPATVLHYVNPPASGFRLEATGEDSAHLVLNLVGPNGVALRGAALFLTCETGKVAWADAGGTDPLAKAGTAFPLGSPALFKSKRSAGALQVGIFQTSGPSGPAVPKAVLVSVALDLVPAKTLLSGTAVALGPTPAMTSTYLDTQGVPRTMAVAVGVLTAQ